MGLARRIGVIGVAAAALLAAVPPETTVAAGSARISCGQRVLRDWSDDGRIEQTFAPHCYREAIAHLPTDVRVYSTAETDITRALARVAAERSAHGSRSLLSGPAVPAKPPSIVGPGSRPVAPIAASAVALAIVAWAVVAAFRRSARGEAGQ